VTVISNKNPAAVRPSEPLARNSTVLHHDPATGDFSRWDPGANQGRGGWDPISQSEARSLVGGDPAAPRAAPAPVPDQEEEEEEEGATP
jgi:hypothetical protein